MDFKSNKIKKSKLISSDQIKLSKICKVSIASKEIMLDRFSNGKEIDFPFSQ